MKLNEDTLQVFFDLKARKNPHTGPDAWEYIPVYEATDKYVVKYEQYVILFITRTGDLFHVHLGDDIGVADIAYQDLDFDVYKKLS